MALYVIPQLFAGLGMFLYGMNLMGGGLEKAAGNKMKHIIGLLTKNRFISVLVGIFVTGIIQSSSATTVMVVGFVNASLMSLNQAIGIIMGANIGTTVTAQLVSFDLESIAPVAIGIGVLLMMLKKTKRAKNFAEILVGFGILFVGMNFMKNSLAPLREYQGFRDLLIYFGHNAFLGILMGFVLTLILQSSSASIGILVALASQGVLPLESALPILYGDNIGTCTTALISSIGASRNAQRAAIMHLVFNIIGTILFSLILMQPIKELVIFINPDSTARQIANAHSLFNIINVVIQFPFAGLIVKIAEKLVPITVAELSKVHTSRLDERMLETPTIALENTLMECLNMGELAKSSLVSAMKGFVDKDEESVKEVLELEKQINQMQLDLVDYLVKLSNTTLSEDDRTIVDNLFSVVSNVERVGDHAENIAELAAYVIEENLQFSEEALIDIDVMYQKVFKSLETALEARKTGKVELAEETLRLENQVDMIEKACRAGHISRLNQNVCNPSSGIMFLDLFSNLERVSDHALNIADSVLSET
ncbi:MAG: Na/Pi cotransporter family protein [Filifactor alocis]|nr:Na/Pi cotransporter family protein [Filifactor alocis]